MELRSTIRNSWALLMTVLAIILLVGKACSPSGLFGGGEVVVHTDTLTITETNTVRVADEHYRDSLTTWFHQNPKKVPEYIYVDRELPGDTVKSDSSQVYSYGAKDSLLNYMIYVRSIQKPDGVWLEYDVPSLTITDSSFVRDSTSTIVTNNITKKVRVNQLYVGPEVIINPGFKGGLISADFIHKQGWQVELAAGYGNFGDRDGTMFKVAYKPLITFRKKR